MGTDVWLAGYKKVRQQHADLYIPMTFKIERLYSMRKKDRSFVDFKILPQRHNVLVCPMLLHFKARNSEWDS